MSYDFYKYRLDQANRGNFVPIYSNSLPVDNYKADAPKYVYKRNYLSKTRKTTRSIKAAEPFYVGSSVIAPFQHSAKTEHPYTKPMLGWDRVFVGFGRVSRKGRPSRSKNYLKLYSTDKSYVTSNRPRFTKWATTYGGVLDGLFKK